MAAEVQATLAGSLSAALREPGNAPFLGRRQEASGDFEWLTYRQVADAAAELAAGLGSLSIPRRACVGIASENRPEWLQADFACTFGDFMNVGLHLAWSEEKLASVMEDAEVQCVVVVLSGLKKLAAAAALCSNARGISFVVLDCPGGEHLEAAAELLSNRDGKHSVTTWNDVLLAGRASRATHTGFGFEDDEDHVDLLDDPSQPYTLMYSSGTSGGAPKATMNSKTLWRESNCNPGAFANISLCKRRAVSYLALAHGADRGIAWQTTFAAGTIGFVRGEEDFEGLLVDLHEVRPTFFLGMAGFWGALFKRHEARLHAKVDATLLAELCAADPLLFGTVPGGMAKAKLDLNSGEDVAAQIVACFKRFDKKGAGKISRDELCAVMQLIDTSIDLTDAALGKLLNDADVDGDGQIDYVKFAARVMQDNDDPSAMAVVAELKRRPVWTELRSAFMATRKGGALRQQLLFAAREEIGGSLETAVTGGSLTPAPVREFMSHMLTDGNETRVKDSYGSTEFPGIAMNGEVSGNVELRLGVVKRGDVVVYSPDDVPNPRGEIQVRLKSGEHSKYWKRPDLDREAWVDGWYSTGDVGELDYMSRVVPNQYFEIRPALGHDWTGQAPLLRIIDRVKQLEEIYVDGDSVWIAVSDLELFYEALPQFQTVVLVSDRNESGLVAVVVLAETELPVDVAMQNATSTSHRGLPVAEELSKQLLVALQDKAQRAGKKSYEIPVGIVVETKRWCEDEVLPGGDRGLITLTGKPKRAAVKQAYHAQWMAQYELAKQSLLDAPAMNAEVPPESTKGAEAEHVARSLVSTFRSRESTEMGAQFECGRPLVVKRGSRTADCRLQVARVAQEMLQTLEDTATPVLADVDVEILPETLAQKTPRGRDWLQDMNSKGSGLERQFEFGKVAAPHTVGDESVQWDDLPAPELARLQDALSDLREIALCMRLRHADWESARKAAVAAATEQVEKHLEEMRFAVSEAIELGDVERAIRAFLRGRRRVERSKQSVERANHIPDFDTAACTLNERQSRLRALGDELDVNTRELPICWSMDMDWCFQEWRSVREVVTCPMCSRNVFMDALSEHTDWITCSDVGLAPLGAAAEGSSMGGNTSIICEITGALIDDEATHLNDPEGAGGAPLWECPTRTTRYHAIGYHVDRLPWAHEALLQLWRIAGDSASSKAFLSLVDKHRDGVFMNDKQGCFWLFDFVKYAGPSPHKRTGGRPDTPASLLVRAFNAFAERPCLAVPDFETLLESDTALSRVTSRTVLPDAAGIALEQRSGFLGLRYKDVGFLVDRIARGLLALGLTQGSYLAISGYNDFEFACADFAVAVAGMVSVSVHGTYGEDDAVAVIDKVKCAALLFPKDLALESRRRACGRWCVQSVRQRCTSLSKLVVMDCLMEDAGMAPIDGSFLAFVSSAATAQLAEVQLPDPFDARGARYQLLDTEEIEDVMTILFTSGSSGTPKAVAVGTKAFIHDVAGCKEEAETISRSITVSYISLTHSSDRYKVWQHVVYGGRVGFLQFGAENWEWRETDKSTAAGMSPVDHLFKQVAALRPNSMSCPPNIWAGLHTCYRTGLENGLQDEAALSLVAARFGNPHRVTHLSTGGAPTPQEDMLFARRLCRHMGCGFVNSYGATEAGAITADGRQAGEKFLDIQVQLIDWGNYTSLDHPFPRGEIVVQSPCLALGYQGDDAQTRQAFIIAGSAAAAEIKPALPPGRWYRTGDLGFFDNTGCLHLLDRASSVICTSRGSELCSGEVENDLESLSFVNHCVVHCRADEILCAVSLANGVREEDLKQTAQWQQFVGALHGEPLQLVVDFEAWTVKNEMLTGTLKKARKRIIDHYFPV